MKVVVSERTAAQLRELGWSDRDMIVSPPLPDPARDAAIARLAATLPKRMTDAAGRLNGALARVLPEGARFEWTPLD